MSRFRSRLERLVGWQRGLASRPSNRSMADGASASCGQSGSSDGGFISIATCELSPSLMKISPLAGSQGGSRKSCVGRERFCHARNRTGKWRVMGYGRHDSVTGHPKRAEPADLLCGHLASERVQPTMLLPFRMLMDYRLIRGCAPLPSIHSTKRKRLYIPESTRACSGRSASGWTLGFTVSRVEQFAQFERLVRNSRMPVTASTEADSFIT